MASSRRLLTLLTASRRLLVILTASRRLLVILTASRRLLALLTTSRRLLALLAIALVPWSILPAGDFVFAWGLMTTTPVHVTTLPDYLFVHTVGLPRRLLAWPVATLLYLLAVSNAALGTVTPEVEDRRVTGGLLVLAGASDLWFSVGLWRPGFPVVPVGTILLWTAAWWFHWPDLRAALWR